METITSPNSAPKASPSRTLLNMSTNASVVSFAVNLYDRCVPASREVIQDVFNTELTSSVAINSVLFTSTIHVIIAGSLSWL
ncbi:hypothetical protein [Enterobacter hormaechei]|uniref:hypothetical protein n=1 Tax=Enterobacter hormaechei TaxID=158836 RepID=UPI00159ECE7F|nr:hypothetical protein [Enterobacter hormaechei]